MFLGIDEKYETLSIHAFLQYAAQSFLTMSSLFCLAQSRACLFLDCSEYKFDAFSFVKILRIYFAATLLNQGKLKS